MKTRKHHNNTGLRQIKRGKTRKQMERLNKIIQAENALKGGDRFENHMPQMQNGGGG